MHNNISIVWDFDGTLTPLDSTTQTVEALQGEGESGAFWNRVHALKGIKLGGAFGEEEWEHILAVDAPIWMYSLSELARVQAVPLNAEFFRLHVLPHVKLYDGVIDFLKDVKSLEDRDDFKRVGIKIHHFIVSAGLKDLIEQVFPDGLITHTFGCRYVVVAEQGGEERPLSVPVYCVDETYKTRSLFEIVKGVFGNPSVSVNKRVEQRDLWSPYSNMIYVGDGPTDVPSLSLTRDKGGLGIAVYDPQMPSEKMKSRFQSMRLDKRADFITSADFSLGGELHQYIVARCIQIRQKYEASDALDAISKVS